MSVTLAKAKEISDALMDANLEPRLTHNADSSWTVKVALSGLDAATVQTFASAHSVVALIVGDVVF